MQCYLLYIEVNVISESIQLHFGMLVMVKTVLLTLFNQDVIDYASITNRCVAACTNTNVGPLLS